MKSILSRESAAVTLDSHAGALWTTWTPSWSGSLRPPLARADSLRTARVCGLLRIRGEGFTRPSDVRKPMVSPAAFVTTTCGFNVPDSTSTWHAPRGSSGGYDRAFCVCGLARILLIPCVIVSHRLARCAGGSRARADFLRTPSVVLQLIGLSALATQCRTILGSLGGSTFPPRPRRLNVSKEPAHPLVQVSIFARSNRNDWCE
jgi:hypothetical protein